MEILNKPRRTSRRNGYALLGKAQTAAAVVQRRGFACAAQRPKPLMPAPPGLVQSLLITTKQTRPKGQMAGFVGTKGSETVSQNLFKVS